MASDTRIDDAMQVARTRGIAESFQVISEAADQAAESASYGWKARAYAKVMMENGYPDLNMVEVRRLVGEE